jgi:hypothetical protein
MSADLVARLRLAVTAWAADWAERVDAWSTVHLDDVSQAQAVEVLDARIADVERSVNAVIAQGAALSS